MKPLALAELVLLAALWGGSFLFMRIAAPVLGPVWLIEVRLVLAALALLPLILHQGLWQDLQQDWKPLTVLGCLGCAVPFVLLAFASMVLPAGFTSILNATTPLFGIVIAGVWLKEQLSGMQWFGFGLGFVGVVILIGWKPVAPTALFAIAVGGGLIAALMYAITSHYAKHHLPNRPSLVISTGSLCSAALILIPLLPFTVPTAPLTPVVILSVVGLALLSTSLAYILYFRLLATVGATQAMTVAYLVPVFAMLWGALLLGETVTPAMVLGCGLVLLGTAITNPFLLNHLLVKRNHS